MADGGISLLFLRVAILLFASNLFLDTEQASMRLTYTPREISAAVTRNVTIRCERGAGTVAAATIGWFRIVKQVSGAWINVAEYTPGGSVTNMTGAKAAGYLSPFDWSGVLQVTWDEATDDTLGSFRCEFFISSDNYGYSSLVTIEETINQDTLYKLWSGLSTESAQLVSCPGFSSKFEKKFATLGRHLNHRFTDAHKTSWKHGSYALLMPKTGCPADFMNEDDSYVKFHEESPSKISNETCLQREDYFHLSQPVGETDGSKCFLHLRFCESKEDVVEVPWPDGQYCINKLRWKDCPPGFSSGRLYLDPEDTSHAGTAFGETADTQNFCYCCKNSASHYTPMIMPKEKPFYLYRYGGACQIVMGMNAAHEFVEIDTESNSDYLYDVYPDIDLNKNLNKPLVINLCYYTKNELD